jgi:DNA polymerase theta
MIRRVLSTGKKALFIVPFVSIAQEKTALFQEVFKLCRFQHERRVRVQGFFGLSGGDTVVNVDVAICTFEKANAIINKSLLSGCLRTCAIPATVIHRPHVLLIF